MKPIIQFIEQNLDSFNNETPPAGHYERFTKKLDDHAIHRKRAPAYHLLHIAALVLFVLLVSALFFREYRIWDKNTSDLQLISSNRELAEAERYYTNQSGIYYKKIEELKFLNNTSEKRQVLQDLRQMDKQVELIKEDLMQYPDNELIMNAIINYYQIKLELMDNIIVRVQNMNNSLL